AVRSTGIPRLASGNPVVVQLEPIPNMAAGVMPWGVTEPLRAFGADTAFVRISEESSGDDPLRGFGDRPVVLVQRDAGRYAWQRDLADKVCSARPGTVVVEMGLPGALAPHAAGYVVTYGAGFVNAVAAAELLLGRTNPEVSQ
ncbi:MAG: glycoside hydrolase family 3 protein, partial [Actinomycetota bacterium]